MIRVALVDDQPLVRMGLATMISAENDLELVGEAGDGREALALLRRTTPDVVLCDIRMPVLDGLEMLREVSADPELADLKVVMLTTFELDEYVFEALRHGASGFLLKDADAATLVDAVRTIARGDGLISPAVTRGLIAEFARSRPAYAPIPVDGAGLASLTPRETEVLALIGEGMSNAEIAAELGMAEATVKSHVTRVLAKLGLASRVQAAIFAREQAR
jgi:DNA-binding NarL/FixJ family response regulator